MFVLGWVGLGCTQIGLRQVGGGVRVGACVGVVRVGSRSHSSSVSLGRRMRDLFLDPASVSESLADMPSKKDNLRQLQKNQLVA